MIKKLLFAMLALLAVAAPGVCQQVFDVVIISPTPKIITFVSDTRNPSKQCKQRRYRNHPNCVHLTTDLPRHDWGMGTDEMDGADLRAWRDIDPLKGQLLKATWDNGIFTAVDCSVLTSRAEKNYLLTPHGCGEPSKFVIELSRRY